MMGRAPQMRQGGGLLSNLLNKGNQMGQRQGMNATRAFGAQNAGGGLLKSLTNPSSLSGFLTNTQKVLNTAQQMGPMVQQYGPLVKNIPAMWKLYRGLKDAPDFTKNDEVKINSSEEYKNEANQTKSIKQKWNNEEPQKITRSSRNSSSPSKPKLYI